MGGAGNWFRLNLVVLVRVNAQKQIRFCLSKHDAFLQRFTGHPMDTQHKHTHTHLVNGLNPMCT